MNAFLPRFVPDGQSAARRPLIGILCCNEFVDRPVQTVASRFVEPLASLSGAAVLLVPALADACDATAVADRLDGLLLTGSRSNVAPSLYGASNSAATGPIDEQRDEVALRLAGRMVETGRPVFGICRGLQELNVLFGGSLLDLGPDRHIRGSHDGEFDALFEHRHAVSLVAGGELARATGKRMATVNSVHHQGIDRLGGGLAVEAVSVGDELIEAFSSRPCGGLVLAVQWHPEWQAAACPLSRGFFGLIGRALGGRDGTASAAAGLRGH